MPEFRFSNRSLENLKGVHPQLVAVVEMALQISYVDFSVICGLRTPEQQAELVKDGKSWTFNSRHLTGHAVDLAPWIDDDIPWSEKSHFDYLGMTMMRAAHIKGEVIEWGGYFGSYHDGAWNSKYDGPHFQLPWQMFPARTDDPEPDQEMAA